MKRHEDWPERLADYVDARRDDSFIWGTNDCATFAAGAVEAMTGDRPSVPIVRTATEFARTLAEAGSLAVQTTRALGVEPTHAAYAQRGDVVLLTLDDRDVLAVCLGASAIAPSQNGLMSTPIESATLAWRI